MKTKAKKLWTILLAAALTLCLALTLGLPVSAESSLKVKGTASYFDFGGFPNAGSDNWLGISFEGVNMNKIGDMQNLAVEDGVLGDYVILKKTGGEAKTVTEWRSLDENYVKRIHGYGNAISICFDGKEFLNHDKIDYVTLKAGFRLFDGTGGAMTWPGDFPTEGVEKAGTILASDVTLILDHAKSVFQPALAGYPGSVAPDALVVSKEPDNKIYSLNSVFDPTGMQITAKICTSDTPVVLDVTKDMVSYDFSAEGEKTVAVSYGGGTVTQAVTVSSKYDVSFQVKTGFTAAYGFGETFDFGSLLFELTDNEGGKRDVAYADVKDRVTVTGFDSTSIEAGAEPIVQTLTVALDGLGSDEISVTVSDRALPFGLTPDYGKAFFNGDIVTIRFENPGAVEGLRILRGVHNCENIADYVLISYIDRANGNTLVENKTVAEIKAAKGADAIQRFYLDQEGGSPVLGMHLDNKAAFTGTDIVSVTLKRGLFWYTHTGDSLNDADWVDYQRMPDVGIDADCHLTIEDSRFYRSVSAVSLASEPEKKNYNRGDTFNPGGATLSLTYRDGGTDEIAVTPDMCAYDFSAAGENLSVTVTYLGKTAQIAGITVNEEWYVSVAVKECRAAYVFGDDFDFAALRFEYTSNKGNKTEVSYEEVKNLVTVSGFDSTAVANGAAQPLSQTLTIAFAGFEDMTVVASISDRNVPLKLEADYGKTFFINNDYAEISFKNPGSVEGLKYLWSADQCAYMGNFVLFSYIDRANGNALVENKTIGEIKAAKGENAMKRFMLSQSGGAPGLRIHFDDKAALTGSDIVSITIKRGLFWYSYSEDCQIEGKWSEYRRMNNLAVVEDQFIDVAGNRIERAVESLTLKSEPEKKTYYLNETMNPGGAVVHAVYRDGGSEDVAVTPDMVSGFDSSVGGTDKTAVVTYNGKTVTIAGLEVKTVYIDRISIGTMPTKTNYALGERIDPAGMKLTLHLKNANGVEFTEDIDVTPDMISDYERYTAGEKTVTVNWAGKTATLNLTYADLNPTQYLTTSKNSYVFFSGDQNNLCVTLEFVNITTSRKALWCIDLATNADDKISFFCKIGDSSEYVWKTVGQLKAMQGSDGVNLLARVNIYGDTLIFNLDSTDLLKTNVKRIKIEEGFYMCWYNQDCYDGSAYSTSANYKFMDNAIFRHNVILENPDGRKWIRPFAEGGDALTVVSQPDKTEYKVGEKVNPTGLVIRVKYEDGFEEDVRITVNEIAKPVLNEAGDAVTVTGVYNGRSFTFTVKVTAEGDEPEKTGCACGTLSLGGGIGGGLALGALALLAFALCRKFERR